MVAPPTADRSAAGRKTIIKAIRYAEAVAAAVFAGHAALEAFAAQALASMQGGTQIGVEPWASARLVFHGRRQRSDHLRGVREDDAAC
jgi:hypothetical protein